MLNLEVTQEILRWTIVDVRLQHAKTQTKFVIVVLQICII